jgi:hypothetical protein
MKNLANKEITIVDAVTNVNTMSKTSAMTGKTIKLGELFFEREDGNFYNTVIDGINYQVFHSFATNVFWLNRHDSTRAKTITVKEWVINEDLKGHVETINLPNSELIGVLCFDENQDGYLNYNYKFQSSEICWEDESDEIQSIKKVAIEFCNAHGVNLMMY